MKLKCLTMAFGMRTKDKVTNDKQATTTKESHDMKPKLDGTAMTTCWKTALFAGVVAALVMTIFPGICAAAEPKDATEATKAANATVLKELPFVDKQDFEFAQRGFIARPRTLIIKNDKGNVVWDMESYKFIGLDEPAPNTVNPSLWRNAQLNNNAGLFKVSDRIYQVRGYDISNITFIQGDTG
jgi:alkyl sulfatase BDS1-like metallo-beta-lactamase superfamily hydrolase